MSAPRKLAAILFTDIVGYTAIMHRSEEEAVTAVKRHNEVMEAAARRYSGEILNFYGDGCLCIFPSVIEALECALEVQQNLQAPPVVPLRIGVHIGEVFFEGDKVLGDDVNIAARILTLAQERTVLFSAEVRDKIRNRPQLKSVALGTFTFKNLEEPMEVFALAAGGLRVPEAQRLEGKLEKPPHRKKRRFQWIGGSIAVFLIIAVLLLVMQFKEGGRQMEKEKSIAVLPFVNISNDPEQNYFTDGMTEEIITQLNKVSDLKVISRSTAMLYKNTHKSTRQIARELGVASVLAGSIRKAGDDIRISAQLIDARSQEQLWAENYDHQRLSNVFSIQSEVARQIARELNARLSREEKVNLDERPTNNPEAYDLFLQARYAFANAPSFAIAETLLLKAIQLDPSFSLAYSYLANLYVLEATWSGYLQPAVSARKAMHVLQDKLQNDTLYIDFNTLASIEFLFNKNYPQAEYYYQRSISTNPKEELTYNMYGLLLTILGRIDEALAQLDKARALSPVSSFEAIQRAEAYFASARYDEAIAHYRKAIETFPTGTNLLDGLGRCYVQQKRYTEAIQILSKALVQQTRRPPSTVAYLALANFRLNDAQKADSLIEELKQRAARNEKGTNVFIALYYSAVNDRDAAFHYLNEAFGSGDVDLIWLKQEPSFANLRSDARFAAYLRKAGFR